MLSIVEIEEMSYITKADEQRTLTDPHLAPEDTDRQADVRTEDGTDS